MPESVTVIGGSGALGSGLALRLGRAGVLVCGDRKADKRVVAELVHRIPGLRCVDCGRLEQARIVEPLTALLIAINGRYKAHAGIRITGLPGEPWPSMT